MSTQNRDFTAKSGQWTRFDVSLEGEYAPLVGTSVEAVESVETPHGKVVGVVLRTSGGDLRAEVEADDPFVELRS